MTSLHPVLPGTSGTMPDQKTALDGYWSNDALMGPRDICTLQLHLERNGDRVTGTGEVIVPGDRSSRHWTYEVEVAGTFAQGFLNLALVARFSQARLTGILVNEPGAEAYLDVRFAGFGHAVNKLMLRKAISE